MAFVIKVSHANGLRRLTWRKEDVGEEGIPFAALEARIREVLQAPASSSVSMTYTDAEGDVVTMANDQDVHDALFQQKLNPLRLAVTLDSAVAAAASPSPSPAAPEALPAAALETDVTIKQVLSKLSNPEIRKVLQSYEPLIEKVASPTQASVFLESLLRNVATQVASVVKHGADVASSAASPFGFAPSQSGGSPSATSSSTSSRTSEGFSGLAQAEENKSEAAGKQKSDADSVVHSGVSCDLCEMSPIVGPRYKSKVRYNYDLCSGCFEKNGREEEYQRIEQSMFRPRHLHGAGLHRMPPPLHPLGQPGGFHGRPFGGMRGHPFGRQHHCHMPAAAAAAGAGTGKLDSRFVCDVTMFDGTEVAPKANFTKIWRLRNSGGVAWPVRTSLVHVGGDELGQVSMVPLEIPPHGLAPEGEMEVAVDMVAPEKPGRYVSHWRLASPAGPKFGHRIWVVIQVVVNAGTTEEGEEVERSDAADSSEKALAPAAEEPAAEATAESVVEGDESAPGHAEGDAGAAADDSVTSLVNVVVPTAQETGSTDTINVSDVQEKNLAPEAGLGEGYAMVDVETPATEEDKNPKAEQEEKKEQNVGELEQLEEVISQVGGEKSDAEIRAEVAEDGSRISYPKLDVVDQGPITYPVVQSAPEGEESGASEGGDSLKTSMAKLQAMGFTNAKLNLELLEKNNLDLRTTLDDLCAVEEWDPILEELQEMGFYDVDVNRRLMFKNNGSVKRVVKELVQMYRNLQEKGRNGDKAE